MPNGRPWTPALFLESLSQVASGCWEWTGYRDDNGYGDTYYLGKKDRTHRVAWQLLVGPLTAGDFVLHKCDNPPCCNPQHLFLGNQTANMRDCANKGRLRTPDKEFLRKKARKSVTCIPDIAMMRARGASIRHIARHLGLSFGTVQRICAGTHWQTQGP